MHIKQLPCIQNYTKIQWRHLLTDYKMILSSLTSVTHMGTIELCKVCLPDVFHPSSSQLNKLSLILTCRCGQCKKYVNGSFRKIRGCTAIEPKTHFKIANKKYILQPSIQGALDSVILIIISMSGLKLRKHKNLSWDYLLDTKKRGY